MLLARGLTMRLVVVVTCSVMVSCLGVLPVSIFTMVIAMTPAAAQQGDLNAILRRFNELVEAGNYPAALMQAQSSKPG